MCFGLDVFGLVCFVYFFAKLYGFFVFDFVCFSFSVFLFRLDRRRHDAGAQLGVNEEATQEVRAIRSGARTERVYIGEGRRGLEKGPMKKGIGVVVHGVGIAGGLGGWC